MSSFFAFSLPAAANVASLRAPIEQAFAFRGFVPYREVWGYVRGIEEAIDVLEAQLEQGDGGDVVDLAEHALKAAERALDHIDDSYGQMGDAIDVYRRQEEDVIAGKDKRTYAEAVRQIDETMRALYAESGQPEDFDACVEEVRTGHKPKRNLMKLMAGLESAKSMS
jgi:hypothetical protein